MAALRLPRESDGSRQPMPAAGLPWFMAPFGRDSLIAIIALGFKRYGFHDEAGKVARGISGAASYFQGNQLPQLYSGTLKEDNNFPVQYLGANVPQAWAAGSAFALLQAMRGFAPDAPGKRLNVDPALPDWLPDVTLTNLRIGADNFSIRFWRDGVKTQYEVLQGEPSRVTRQSFGAATRLS